jgi:alkylated DNA nucleotide flippase Atl1
VAGAVTRRWPAEPRSVYARIYAIVRRIPRGRVCTYGHIAQVAGCSGARQVGYALHSLKDGTAVPWHRVVNARGAISLPGSSGITQRLRLEKEGVRCNAGGAIDLTDFGWPRQAQEVPLWRCPKCGRAFANRNQSHACGRHSLSRHFAGKSPAIRALYRAAADAIRAIGPVTVLPEKTRIAFQVRMSFAQVTPKKGWLDGHVVLARRLEHPRFRSVQTISPRNHVHAFRIERLDEIDDTLRSWLREAYAVGAQQHLKR